jgi:hypothetical protein
MINDRHGDPEPYVFSTSEAAIDYAQNFAKESAHDENDFQESPIDAWLYYATYSVESDSVWVIEKTIDET